MITLELGNVPEWISAITATLALILAAIVAIFAWKQSKASIDQVEQLKEQINIESKRDQENSDRLRQEEKNREMAQASLISCWVVGLDQYRTGVIFLNNSTSSVYDIIISVGVRGLGDERNTLSENLKIKLSPTGKFLFRKVFQGEEVIEESGIENKKLSSYEKRAGWTTAVEFDKFMGHNTPVLNSETWRINSFKFKDSEGRSWERNKSGKLIQIEDYNWEM